MVIKFSHHLFGKLLHLVLEFILKVESQHGGQQNSGSLAFNSDKVAQQHDKPDQQATDLGCQGNIVLQNTIHARISVANINHILILDKMKTLIYRAISLGERLLCSR